MRFARRTTAALAAALLALLAAACGDDADEGGVVVAAISGSPDQLDPHLTSAYASFQILENVYDTLVEPDESLEMQPALAESWETSEDGLTWTFELRPGVLFHDGAELTAEDVVYSMDRIRDEGQNAFRLEAVDEVVATGDLAVEFRLERPAPDLLEQVGAFKGMAIVSQDFVETGDPAVDAVGTGPFRLATFDEATGATLEANLDYWGDGPFVDGVEYRFISEPTAALTALEGGEIDWTDNIPPAQVEAVGGDLTLEQVASNDYWYVAFNHEVDPFGDVEVRRALATAVDRDPIVDAALFGAATPNQGAIPETSDLAFDLAPFDHDPDAARDALAEAGADGLSFELMVTDEYPETIAVAQVLADQWAQVGVQVEIDPIDFSTWLARQEAGDFDALLLGWLGNISYDDFYVAQHTTDGQFNAHGYSNEEVDAALAEARSSTDDDERRARYQEAATILTSEVSYLYLYNPDVVHAWGDRLGDYTPRSDRAIRWEGVRLG